MKPICVKCQRFYSPSKNGRPFIECMPEGNGAPPGTQAPERWSPYKLWMGDEWTCEGCQHVLIVGVGREPISEHYMPDFDKRAASFGATIRINDC